MAVRDCTASGPAAALAAYFLDFPFSMNGSEAS